MGCIEHGELLEPGAEGNLSNLHLEEPSGWANTTSRHKGLCLMWFVLSQCLVSCFPLQDVVHPHSRHTLGCSFSLGHGGEENKAHQWEFYFPGKLREDSLWTPGPGEGFPWFYSQLDQPFRWSMTMMSEAFPAGHSFCPMCSYHSIFLRLRCSLET